MRLVYYNEHDAFAAAWLRELIKEGVIGGGEVDERDIQEVQPGELQGFTQCHFFAGIGVWSYALRAAGWADDTAVWTGSCPCQSFSASGKRGGFSDQRHLWPAWFRLIGELCPDTIFGEQVASKDGLAWLDVVSADLEGAGYAIGTADLCAAGFGAPHIRQRLYFVAHASSERRARNFEPQPNMERDSAEPSQRCPTSRMADSEHSERRPEHHQHGAACGRSGFGRDCIIGELGNTNQSGLAERQGEPGNTEKECASDKRTGGGFTNGFWRDAEWLWCRDQRYRPVEPGTFPLAHGAANRVGRLRGYGNALSAPVAIEFIKAYLEIRGRS